MTDKFYITTPIFYVNDKPHLGHAYTSIASDAYARYNRLLGREVFFLTGTDEHGAKIAMAAEAANRDKQQFVDEIAGKFKELDEKFNISNNDFIRTTDKERHWPAVEKIWNAMDLAGDIYKGNYKGLYCVGHEAFMKKSDLNNGICPDHQTKPEVIEEENYFFKLTKYKDKIEKLYKSGEIKIFPKSRKK